MMSVFLSRYYVANKMFFCQTMNIVNELDESLQIFNEFLSTNCRNSHENVPPEQ